MVGYKKNKRSLIIKPPATPKRILTPAEENLTLCQTNQAGVRVYVVEIPGCRFNGLPLCLSSSNKADVIKMHVIKHDFRRFYNDVARKFG